MKSTVVIGGAFTPSRNIEMNRARPGSLEKLAEVAHRRGFGGPERRTFSMLAALENPHEVAEAAGDGALLIHSDGNLVLPALVKIAKERKHNPPAAIFSANGPGGQHGPKIVREAKLYVGGGLREIQHLAGGIAGPHKQAHRQVAQDMWSEMRQQGGKYLGLVPETTEFNTVDHLEALRAETGAWCGMLVARHDVFFPNSPTSDNTGILGWRFGNHDSLVIDPEDTLLPVAEAYQSAA